MALAKNGEIARLSLGSRFADVAGCLDFFSLATLPFQQANFTHLSVRQNLEESSTRSLTLPKS